jgi:hypothetical protein
MGQFFRSSTLLSGGEQALTAMASRSARRRSQPARHRGPKRRAFRADRNAALIDAAQSGLDFSQRRKASMSAWLSEDDTGCDAETESTDGRLSRRIELVAVIN